MRSPSKRCTEGPVDDDRSEAGDTLIEVLFAIVILAIGGVALMTGFATALTNTATQRELVNRETSIRAATAEAIADIQNASNNLFVNAANCATSTPVPPAFSNLPTNFTVSTSVLYWNGTSFASGGTNPQCQNAPQQWTLTVTDGTVTSTVTTVVSDPNAPSTASYGTPAKLVFLQPTASTPGSGTINSALSPQPLVAVEDSSGNIVYNDASSVTLSVAPGGTGTGTLSSNCAGTENDGVFSFGNCSLSATGTYNLLATDSLTTSSGAVIVSTSNAPYTVSLAPPAKLVFTAAPTLSPPSFSGQANSSPTLGKFTVQEQDAWGNPASNGSVTVGLVSTSPGGVFSLTSGGPAVTSIQIPAGSNSASFYYGDTAAGSPTITASTSGLAPATANGAISAGPEKTLAITTQPPTSITVHQTFAVGVSVEDQYGNVITTGTGNNDAVKIALSTGTFSTGSATATATASAGVASFSNLMINSAGTNLTITATDTTHTTVTSATTNQFTVGFGAPAKFVFTSSPTGNQNVGTSASVGPFVVQAQDGFGDAIANNTGSPMTLTLTSSSKGPDFFTTTSGGTTGVTVTIPNGASSSPSFYYSDQAAGSPTITATGSVNGTAISGTNSGFAMVAGAENALAITTQPSSSVTAGTAFTVGVSVEDQFGNVITTGTGNNDALSVTLNSGSFASGSTTTATASSGVASFSNLKVNGSGSYTVTVSDTTHTSVTSAITNSFSIVAATPNKFVFTSSPTGNQTVNSIASVGPFVVQAQDQFGNPVTNSGSAVTLGLSSSSSGHPFFTTTSGGTTGVTVTIPNGASSSPSFYYSDQAAGSPTITATGSVNGTAISGTNSGFAMVAGAENALAITTQPSSSVTAGTAFTVGVSVEDQFGNVITTGTGNNDALKLTLSSGTFSTGINTATATASAGVASFSGLKVNNAGSYTLTASDTTTSTITTAITNSFSIVATTPNKLIITTQPPSSSITAGAAFGAGVSVEDQYGNVVTTGTGSTDSIKFTLSSGSFASGSTSTVSASGGVANFSNLLVNAAGSYTMTASDSSRTLTTAITNSFSIVAATPNKFVFTSSPTGNQTVNSIASVGPFVVQAQDQFGNPVTNSGSAVTLGLSSSSSGHPFFTTTSGGTTGVTVTIPNGASSSPSFYYSDQAAGSPTITATGSVNGTAISGTNSGFAMVAGAENALAITTQPSSSVTAGTAFTVGVSVEDQFGNVITTGTGNNDALSVTLNSGSFASGSTTTATASSGVASFSNLKVNGSGSYTVTVSDTTHTSVTSAITNSFSIVAATPNKFVFTSSPTGNQTVNSIASVGPFVVQAQDQFGNPVTNSGSAVTLGLSSSSSGHPFFTTTSGGTTGVTVTIPNGASSSPSFYYSDQAAGSPTITATGSVNGTAISGTNSGFAMVAGAENALAITTQPSSSVTAGTAFTVGVSVEDQFGNVITTGTGNNDALKLTLSSGTFSTGINTATATASAGVASFSGLKVNNAGSYTLTASDTTTSTITTAMTNSFSIVATTPNKLIITTQPPSSSITAGAAFGAGVSVEDQYGNVVTTGTGSTDSIKFTLSSGSFASGSTSTVSASGGVANFSNLLVNAAGSYTMTASDSSRTLTTAITNSFSIVAAGPNQLLVTSQPPSSTTAGTAFATSVSVEDQFGNVVVSGAGNNDTISLALSSGTFSTGSNTATATASAGVASFSNLKINTAGNYTITASDSTTAGVGTATTNQFAMVAGAEKALAVTTQPSSSVTAGTAFTVGVSVEDQYGNVITTGTGNNDALKLTLSSGTFSTGINTATATASAGVASFSGLKINNVGSSYTIAASDTTHGTVTGTSTNSFAIVAATPNTFVFTSSPTGNQTVNSSASVGPFVVQAQDQFGNPVTNSGPSAVTLTLSSSSSGSPFFTTTSGGTTGVTVTIPNGSSSSPSFYYSDQAAGSPTIAASGTINGVLVTGTNSSFTMVPTSEKTLAITTQPSSSILSGTTFTVGVSVEDQYGNVITTGTGSNDSLKVTLSSGSFVSGSTTTATASAGVATFSNLSISTTGNYTITASDTTHTSVSSAATSQFSIVHPVAVLESATTNTGGSATSATITSIGSTTPSAGSTILVFVYAEGLASVPSQPTVAGAGISGTPALVSSAAPGGTYKEWAFSANASGSSKTIQVTFSGSVSDIGLDAVAVTGDNTAVNATGQATTGSGTSPIATLTNTPAAGDLELAFLGTQGNSGGQTTPSGWTLIESANKASNPAYGTASYYTSTNTGTSQTFTIKSSAPWATMALDVPVI